MTTEEKAALPPPSDEVLQEAINHLRNAIIGSDAGIYQGSLARADAIAFLRERGVFPFAAELPVEEV